jgi:hypothetical protein
MITALLAIAVAMILGVTVMQTSFHTTHASAYDRARTQSVHAAEAGLDVVLSTLPSTATLPCALTGTLSGTPVATWSATITYYPSYPLIGSALACVGGYLPGTSIPGGAVIDSIGSVTNWPTGTVERTMQTEVRMSPLRGAFDKAIFSDETPVISNNLTIYGDNGNNADVITNSDWTCVNSLLVYGSLYVQGTASMGNSCRTMVDLWANDAITMSNSARVDHDAKSSTGNLTMTNNSAVGNNVVIGGSTCSGCAGKVGGSITTGHVQPPPPTTEFPEITFDAASWTDDGWSIASYTDCDAAKSWILDSANQGSKTVIRITGGCTLDFTNNTTITRTEDLAVFTDGEITTNNRVTWQTGDSSWHDLFLIVESGASCTGTDGRITMSNLTSFDRLYFFVYSPCLSTFANNNTSGRGQIYGNVVAATNNLTFTFHAMLVPGAGAITGYQNDVQFVREIN